jgi:hypothetical protein
MTPYRHSGSVRRALAGHQGWPGPEAEDGPDGAVSLAERDPLQLPARKFWIERNSVPE